MKQFIYADNAATTKLDIDAFEAMKPYLLEEYGNASQPYSFARKPKQALKEARAIIAHCINADPEEIYFTSGGTESDNWAVKGIAFAEAEKRSIVTSQIEHHAILRACETLEKHGYVSLIEQIVQEDYFKDYIKEFNTFSLNEEQQKAVDTIVNSKDEVYLLQGVTGSGKTEVYLKLVEHYVSIGKSAIVLVPEISLTPMIIQRFKNRFKDIAVLHGSLSAKEKQIQYDKIKNQEVKVVIGARSAIFAPLQDIGIIILDEEQSTSYKQDKDPSYHARDIAILRAKHFNAKVVLGSATPPLESFARALNKNYQLTIH